MRYWLCIIAIASITTASQAAPIDFGKSIQPIFAESCVRCHGAEKQRGGLRLDRKADAFRGGDSGAVLRPGKANESLLWQLVSGKEADRQMPPSPPHLTPAQVQLIQRWIDEGAHWPDDGSSTADPLDWWSLRPIQRPALPNLNAAESAWVRNPIDTFIRTKLRENGLTPNPEADRRTLIRRVTFDLIGLPPTPAEIDAFLADSSVDAYERLVDRLLASPHYGERWARHWLDVVHYGDTHGYDKDQPRPNAWPYRDYVIRAFNADKPYARFIQEQIAGDRLYPNTMDGITALGFLSAGPWDLIGHAEVPETKIDGKVARHLDRDDMVANTMNTFISLTVQCAQCHQHKFDPISQVDYYRLHAVFAALDRAERPYPTNEADAERIAGWQQQRRTAQQRYDQIVSMIRPSGAAELAELDARIRAASKPQQPRPEFGYHSGIEGRADVPKWVQFDLGEPRDLARIVLWGCHDDFNSIGAGFGFPVRYRIESSDEPTFEKPRLLIDRTTTAQPNPGIAALSFELTAHRARYVRITATQLAPRMNDYIFALAEVELHDAKGSNLARQATITALDSIEAAPRWRKSNLIDGYAPGQGRNLTELTAQRQRLFEQLTPAESRTELSELERTIARLDGLLQSTASTGRVYAGTVHHGSGAFRGTGPDGGRPRPIHVLRRGDVTQPTTMVGPGTIPLIKGWPAAFQLPADHHEGDRRVELARWLSDERNPLTWRSIVNRMWQYHFGKGLVTTPNDFGRMGQSPSHPELLDYLAADFRDGGQSLKRLHRQIVTSATYRQTSTNRADGERIDAGNTWLWKMPRRKLEAEAVRDAVLQVAGQLDRTLYGPAFQDFVVEHPAHSPHYQYHLYDPNDRRSHRRSIYRFLVRSKPQPLMSALDCADPSMQVEKRNETMSPLQALALLNNGFMLAMSKRFAERLPANEIRQQVHDAFREAVGRTPSQEEWQALTRYAEQHGLINTCRVLFNTNEFMFID